MMKLNEHKLLLINRRAANLRKSFENKTSVNIKVSRTQMSKIV